MATDLSELNAEEMEHFNNKIRSAAQELIDINLDSYTAYTKAVRLTRHRTLREHFSALAEERIRQAVDLHRLLRTDEEKPMIAGRIAGRIHRTIMDWRDRFVDGPSAVLGEILRGEKYIKAKYEALLSKFAPRNVPEILQNQYAATQEAHDRIDHLYQQMKLTGITSKDSN